MLAQGLRDGEFFKSLAKKSALNFDNMLCRAEKSINKEEAPKMKWMKEIRKRKRRRLDLALSMRRGWRRKNKL